MGRRVAFFFAALLLGSVIAFALAEGAARFYVYVIAERGKLFEPDAALGWRPIPKLDLRRRNADGDAWRIRTNSQGYRSRALGFAEAARRRVLVLGDSYAFGEGIDEADRFDALLAERFGEWSFVNQGVMGYGTDQQLIGGRELIKELGPGDVILLLTFVNDFSDLLRRSHSGRSKPWFELERGELIEHPPALGPAQWVRDRSYVLARILQILADRHQTLTESDVRYCGNLYRRLVLSETADARARGVEVLIAYHGTSSDSDPVLRPLDRAARKVIQRTCLEPGVACLSLDPVPLGTDRARMLQTDGHWAAGANRVVADSIAEHLSASPESR